MSHRVRMSPVDTAWLRTDSPGNLMMIVGVIVFFQVNAAELTSLSGSERGLGLEEVNALARELAQRNGRAVFVTAAERGMICASPSGEVGHVPALPLRGPIDIVGAGDAVTANLASALAARAEPREALEIANTAASVVIHQLGTTGTTSVSQIQQSLI